MGNTKKGFGDCPEITWQPWGLKFFNLIGYTITNDTHFPVIEQIGSSGEKVFIKFMSSQGKTDMEQANAFEEFLKTNKLKYKRMHEDDYLEDAPHTPTRYFTIKTELFYREFNLEEDFFEN